LGLRLLTVLKSFTSVDGKQRVHIVRRPDGAFSFLRQFQVDPNRDRYSDAQWQRPFERERGWGPPSFSIGIYDSAETAEWEALCKVEWMAEILNSH
jgi:hypothetical protein